MRAPRRTCRSDEVWTVSRERSSPRGYAFFVPLGGGESRLRITPTFTGQGYYSKTAAWLRGGFDVVPDRDSTAPWFDRQLQVELQGFSLGLVHDGEDAVVTQTSARWRMMLGSPATVKDQPASPQPSPRTTLAT